MIVPFFDLKKQFHSIRDEVFECLQAVFNNCAFIGGNTVFHFERDIAEYLGVNHAIGCGNGTDALVLALKACGVKPGDEVITTAFSFFATAEAIASVGAIPVFVDVKASDYTIDPDWIEYAVTEKTKAIIPVHIFGCCCDMDRIMDIARKHGLYVIEDAAQAIGSSYKGVKAGCLGDIACFSFYPTKNLGGCGDGGMCVTNNPELAINIKALREHGAGKTGAMASLFLNGVVTELEESSESESAFYDPYKYYNFLIGHNSRLDAIQACVLSIKLRRLDEYNARRAEIAKKYMEGLTHKVIKPSYAEHLVPCWHQFVIITERKSELCAFLGSHGIGCGTFYPVPLHKQKAFNSDNSRTIADSLPVAEELARQTVCLPIYPELTDEEVVFVIAAVNAFFEENGHE